MSVLPKTELEIIALAQTVVEGLTRMSADFPAPPVPVSDLVAWLADYTSALHGGTEADMVSKVQVAAKNQAVQRIREGIKANLGYAEITARKDALKLAGLGWGPKRERTPLETPGEVRDIVIGKQGAGFVLLKWTAPVNGGAPAAYEVQRQQDNGSWEEAGVSATTEHVAANQPRGVSLNYRVIAVNRAGSGAPSGVVSAVL